MNTNFTYRAPTWDDVPQVLELLNKQAAAMSGRPDTSESDLKNEWTSPGFSMETDVQLVHDSGGRLVGYVDYYNSRGEHARPFAYCVVDPDVDGAPILPELVKWAESRARADIPKAPPGVKFSLLVGADLKATGTLDAWRQAGFSETRRFHHMHAPLDGSLQTPRVPEGYRIRVMADDEIRAVFSAILVTFRDHYGHVKPVSEEDDFQEFKHHIFEADDYVPELQFVAIDPKGGIAGMSLCRPEDGPDKDTGWVSTLGVVGEHRGKGLGEALLRHSFVELQRMGKKAVGLGVDAFSLTNATRLYEKCGMKPSRVFVQLEKALRDGRESANLG